MNVRLIAALAAVGVFFSATAAVSAQTTMAPAPGPAMGPTAAPHPSAGSDAPLSAPTARPPALMPIPVGGPLALDARYLRGMRTAPGYRLTGEALVKDACTAARFTRFLGNVFPPQFNVVQYRRPGTTGLLCVRRPTWVTIAPVGVTSAAPPRYVNVRTQKGVVRAPILPGPVY